MLRSVPCHHTIQLWSCETVSTARKPCSLTAFLAQLLSFLYAGWNSVGIAQHCCLTVSGQSTVGTKVGTIDPRSRRAKRERDTLGNIRRGTEAADNLGC